MRRPDELGVHLYFSLSLTNLCNNSWVVLLVRTGFYPKVKSLITGTGYFLCPSGIRESAIQRIQRNVSEQELNKLLPLRARAAKLFHMVKSSWNSVWLSVRMESTIAVKTRGMLVNELYPLYALGSGALVKLVNLYPHFWPAVVLRC